jgi:hypothetical protein
MNRYGRIAQEHWERWAPTRYAALEDPTAFFTDLGEQIEREVLELATHLAGPDPAGEEYLAKVGRLQAARSQAEEQVLHELAYVSDDPTQDLSEDLEDEEGPDVDLVHQVQAAIDRARQETDTQEA